MSANFCSDLISSLNEDSDPGISLGFYTDILRRQTDLLPGEAVGAMKLLMSGNISELHQKEFLLAMQEKQVSVDELAAFAFFVRRAAEKIPLGIDWSNTENVLGDTCGTGGGTVSTFNVSTSIMFILAAAGIIVAKHGNRSITSKCGSADVLEALGVNISMSPTRVGRCISDIGVGFIFAPNFHKSFKHVQSVRKNISGQTIFNILGPLCNPAFYPEEVVPACQVLGVFSPDLTEKLASVLKRLNVTRALVVHGLDQGSQGGMDEISSTGETKISEIDSEGVIQHDFISPEQLGINGGNSDDLKGGDAAENAEIIRNLLKNTELGPKRDLMLVNAAAGLYVCGKADSLKSGVGLAKEIVGSGNAFRKMEELIGYSNLQC